MANTAPKTPEGKAKALANLKPFQPGQSGNPAGRPAAGAAVAEWMNVMQDWSKTQLQEVADDDSAPSNKVSAALEWLSSRSADPRERANALDRIMDRTQGKPTQTVKMDTTINGGDAVQGVMGTLLSNPKAFAAAETLLEQLEAAEYDAAAGPEQPAD